MLTRDSIHGYREDDLRSEVVIPLLKAMGYHDVEHYHGQSGELGKDVTAWRVNDLGNRRNLVVVVKAGNITGQAARSPRSAGEVATQIRQAFGSPFLDKADGIQQRANDCWVLTNGTISKEARAAIGAELSSSNLNVAVQFIDGERLWGLVEEYLAVPLLQKMEELQKELNQIDTHYQPLTTLSDTGIQVALKEKFPGASLEKPLALTARFRFPNSEEGNMARESIGRSLDTGTPVEIPPQFIENIEYPALFREVSRQIFGIETIEITGLEILPLPGNRRLIVRIELCCDDGDNFILDYVELRFVHGGNKELTFSNDDQQIPIRVRLILRLHDREATIQFSPDGSTFNAFQLQSLLHLIHCLSKPLAVRIVGVDSGIPLFSIRIPKGVSEGIHPERMELIDDLAAIQLKIKRPILVPDRPFTADELETIAKLRTALHEGKSTGEWEQFTLVLTKDGAREIIAALSRADAIPLRVVTDEAMTLFGTAIPLRIEATIEQARLQSEEEVRALLEQTADEGISCRFVPGDRNTATITYLDWASESTPLRE